MTLDSTEGASHAAGSAFRRPMTPAHDRVHVRVRDALLAVIRHQSAHQVGASRFLLLSCHQRSATWALRASCCYPAPVGRPPWVLALRCGASGPLRVSVTNLGPVPTSSWTTLRHLRTRSGPKSRGSGLALHSSCCYLISASCAHDSGSLCTPWRAQRSTVTSGMLSASRQTREDVVVGDLRRGGHDSEAGLAGRRGREGLVTWSRSFPAGCWSRPGPRARQATRRRRGPARYAGRPAWPAE